ncbi:MAG: response regulator transcription factor [Bacteroidales bacterium]|nr:response regulator transcription factor [Bacteroidales bacterium]
MDVAIIEDEKITANNLEKLLKQFNPDIRVTAKLSSVEESVFWLQNNQPELIFCDIHLSDGLAFEIFEKTEVKAPVIFTTAFDEYAIKAFKLNSIDYLLKPVRLDELQRSIEKYKEIYHEKQPAIDYNKILKAYDKKENKKRFIVYCGQKIKPVEISDIAYFYSLEKNTYLCTFSNKHYPVEHSLDKIELLINKDIFFRVNRKYIVQFNSIKEIIALSKSRIKIKLNLPVNEDILVSIPKTPEFRQWLNQ